VDFDVRLRVELLVAETTLEAVGRHLVGLIHVGLQLGGGKFLDTRKGEELLFSREDLV
jgi:hypothetical protein